MNHPGLAQWFSSGERGISSNTIAVLCTVADGGPIWLEHMGHPLDPADFRRCERLLRAVPTLRPMMETHVKPTSPEWAALVDHWDEIIALLEEEIPGVFDRWSTGSAPKTYDLMKACRNGTAA